MTALGFIETRGLVAAISGADAMLKAAEVRLLGKDLVGGGLVTVTVAGEVAAVRASVDAGIAAVRDLAGTLVSRHVIARPDVALGNIIAARSPAVPSVASPIVSPGAPTTPPPGAPTTPPPGAPPGASPGASPGTSPATEVARQGEAASAPTLLSEVVAASEEVILEATSLSEFADAAQPVGQAVRLPGPEIGPATGPATGMAATRGKAEKPESAPAAIPALVRHDVGRLKKMGVSGLRRIARGLSGIAMTPEKIASAGKEVLLEKIVNAYRQIEEQANGR